MNVVFADVDSIDVVVVAAVGEVAAAVEQD